MAERQNSISTRHLLPWTRRRFSSRNATQGTTNGTNGSDSTSARRPSLTWSLRSADKTPSRSFFRPRRSASQPCNAALDENQVRAKPGDPALYRLPPEVLLDIICELPYRDLVSLRQTSRVLYALIDANERQCVRHQLRRHVPVHITQIYIPPAREDYTLDFLAGLAHRQRVCGRLASMLADDVTRFYFMRTSAVGLKRFRTRTDKMRERMVPSLLVLYHYFETLRALFVSRLAGPVGGFFAGDLLLGDRRTAWEQEVLQDYDSTTLLQISLVWNVLYDSFVRYFRPPSYAGRLERSLLGFRRRPPPEQSLAIVFLIGGLDQVERLWRIKRYDQRIKALDEWLDDMQPSSSGTRTNSVSERAIDGSPSPPLSLPQQQQQQQQQPQHRQHQYQQFQYQVHPDQQSRKRGRPMPPLSPEELEQVMRNLPSLRGLCSLPIVGELRHRGVIRTSAELPDTSQFLIELIRLDGVEVVHPEIYWPNLHVPDIVAPVTVVQAMERIRLPVVEWP
ncbi:MAG: hypothetical protein M1823_001565 [Watsoniomyces obsoletus]|nr:MAG: hypothetical protein M1823_001565 [Watsoniomyces obsoletus]